MLISNGLAYTFDVSRIKGRLMFKQIVWHGNTREILLSFPKNVREDIGFMLDCLLHDFEPPQVKHIPEIGLHVKSIFTEHEKDYYLIYIESNHDISDNLDKRVHYIKNSQRMINVLHVFSTKLNEEVKENLIYARKAFLTMQE